MPITVAMIEEKEFKTKMKGYDPVEVDEFLDEICDEMLAMQEEISSLQARVNQAGRGGANFAPAAVPAPTSVPAPAMPPMAAPVPAPAKAPVPEKDTVDEAAQRLLARAQKFYDETVEEAKAEAAKILDNAQARADSGIEDLEEEKKTLQEEIDMLKAAAKDYRERFQRLVEDQQHVLNSEKELFQ